MADILYILNKKEQRNKKRKWKLNALYNRVRMWIWMIQSIRCDYHKQNIE